MRIDGKKCIVIGGASGLGEAIARTFSEAGAIVAVLDIKKAEAEALAAEIGGTGGYIDVLDVPGTGRIMEETIEALGGVDVLVNCAGLANRTPIEDVTEAEWDSRTDVNQKGSFFTAQAAYRHMIKQGSGSIINLSSTRGHQADGRHVIYDATKGAVRSMTQTFAVAGGPYGVRCNCVSPGYVLTPMTFHNMEDPQWKARIESRIPIGRLLDPQEIADTCLFLASDMSSGINGQDVVVDGGWTIHE